MKFKILGIVVLILLVVSVQATEKITNGGFETGDMTGWTLYGSPVPFADTAQKYAGSYSGKIPDYYYYSKMNQQVDLTGVTNLTYWTIHYGAGMTVKVDATTIYTEPSGTGEWTYRDIPVSYTGTHWLNFTGNQDNNWWVDNISANGTTAVTAPVASFTSSLTFISRPRSVTFTDTSTNTPTSWEWNFGDGDANVTTQSPSHVYRRPGIFTVGETATNEAGSSYASTTVRVIIGGQQFTPTPKYVSCEDYTYTVSRELNSYEMEETEWKIYSICYPWNRGFDSPGNIPETGRS